MSTTYPFRNLVFQGGGVKAYAYHGALEVLETAGVLRQIRRTAGTSAGAMMAALVSMRLSAAEIIDVYRTIDHSRLPLGWTGLPVVRNESASILGRELERMQSGFSSVLRLLTRFGWHETSYGYEWMKETVGRYSGDPQATFADFRRRGFRDLYVVVTNVSRHRTEVFCAETTPDVAVVDALLMSQTIPFYFEALQFDGQKFGRGAHYADGGILLNYPIHLFDEPRYAWNNRWYVNGVNWETLGCRLYTPSECLQAPPITSMLSYVQNVFEALAETQTVAFENSKVDQRRTINIDNCCVHATDFTVQPTAGNEKYRRLVDSGREAAEAYLAAYQAPIIKSVFHNLSEWVWRTLNGL